MAGHHAKLSGLLFVLCVLVLAAGVTEVSQAEETSSKPRLMVLTDIGGDPDDTQSLIRLLLYANEFEIEGLIASASGTPGELKKAITRPDLIRQIVEAYGQVRKNLNRHADGYPEAKELLGRIQSGNPNRGREAIGDGHDTEGSRWIIKVVDRDDPRPVNLTIWGGQTDLAQALWRVRKDRGEEGLKKFLARLRVYDINDQDRIADWMWEEFPFPFYILASAEPGRDKREGAYRGMYLGGNVDLVSREWMETNIRQDHGPLGALYPPRTWTAPNPHSAIKEGDTPSWFYFLPTGLCDPAHPEWGSWGGRFQRKEPGIWRDAQDTVGDVTAARASVWRWRPAFQADFQARLDWCLAEDRTDANHCPIAVLNGDKSRQIIKLKAKPGETMELSADQSRDPDGNEIEARWFIYPEAGTFQGRAKLSESEGPMAKLTIPRNAQSGTVHVILEVKDEGKPRLSAFRRAVVRIGDD